MGGGGGEQVLARVDGQPGGVFERLVGVTPVVKGRERGLQQGEADRREVDWFPG